MIEDHRHCYVCGKVVPAHLVKPGESPVLCSLACRRELERREREAARRWWAWYLALIGVVGAMLLWPMIASALIP